MSEKEGEDAGTEKKKTLTLRGGTGLSQGTVRQNFSHGRSKAVVVETRKRKFTKPGETPPAVEVAKKEAAPAPVEEKAVAPKEPVAEAATNKLSNSELEARKRALEESKVRDVEDRKQAAEDEKRRAEEDKRRALEREEAARAKAEE